MGNIFSELTPGAGAFIVNTVESTGTGRTEDVHRKFCLVKYSILLTE
jgi:hypothetical protein